MIRVTNQARDIKTYFVKTDSNVNSTSNVAHQSDNSVNPNSRVSYLNLNNSTSNTNSNISTRLLSCWFYQHLYNYCSKHNPSVPLGKK